MIFDFFKPKPRKRGKLQPRPKLPANTPPETKAPVKPVPPPEIKAEVSTPPVKERLKPVKRESKKDWGAEFLKTFRQLTSQHRPWDVWRDFVTMYACSLSNAVDKSHYDEREALYMRIIGKYQKSEQVIFPELIAYTVMALEDNPEQDFLGEMYMSLELGNSAHGQFFTPYSVCRVMAAIGADDIVEHVKTEGYFTIHDPCCGAGATLIAGIHEAKRQLEKAGLNWQNHVLVVAQDVDEVVALMCYIQLSLLGAAAYVKVGNSLTEPMTEGDSTKNYWYTPIYFSDVWHMRRMVREMSKLFDEGGKVNV